MSSDEQQGISVRRRRSQSLSRRGDRDGRRDRQHHCRKRMSRADGHPDWIGSRPSSSTARPRCSRRSKSSTRRSAPPRPPSTNSSTAPTSRSSPAPKRPPTSTRKTDGRHGPAQRLGRPRSVPSTDLRPNGGTAIGTWLAHVREIAGHHPGVLTHAILLTDGKDEHETPEATRRADRAQRRRIHLRLPRSGNQLARRRASFDLVRTAGHRGHRRRSAKISRTISPP